MAVLQQAGSRLTRPRPDAVRVEKEFRAVAGPDGRNDASAWVIAIGWEYNMSNAVYQNAMALRIAAPLPCAVAPGRDHSAIAGNVCDCKVYKGRIGAHGYHVLACGKGGGRTYIHDAVNRKVAWGMRHRHGESPHRD